MPRQTGQRNLLFKHAIKKILVSRLPSRPTDPGDLEDGKISTAEFCKRWHISGKATYAGEIDRDGWKCDHWKIDFVRTNPANAEHVLKRWSVDYYTGIGHRVDHQWSDACNGYIAYAQPPAIEDVLDHIASQAIEFHYDPALTFESWADSYGYDRDSRKAEAIYHACKREAEGFFSFIGLDARDDIETIQFL